MKSFLTLTLLLTTGLALNAYTEKPPKAEADEHEPTELRGTGCPLSRGLADSLLYDFCDEFGDDVCYRPQGTAQATKALLRGTSDFALLYLNEAERQTLKAQGLCALPMRGRDLFLVIRAQRSRSSEVPEQHAALMALWHYL